MEKLTFDDILKPGYDVSKLGGKIEDTEELRAFIADVIKQQKAILKLKEIDPKQLEIRMTI